jgi:hypothetical protein
MDGYWINEMYVCVHIYVWMYVCMYVCTLHLLLPIYVSFPNLLCILWGQVVVQLVEALRYKSEGRGLNSLWCHWNLSLT